jgi:hypothetical protein
MARRYGLAAGACLAASGLNPYGFAVHAHAIRFLSAKWIVDLVQEYQPVRAGSPEALYFEALLLAGVAASIVLLSRRQVSSALLILAWGHAALTSSRHIPIYAFVCAPLIAREATLLWDRLVRFAKPGSVTGIFATLANAHTAGLARNSVWAPALALGVSVLPLGWNWPVDFPEVRYPAAAIHKNADLISGSRIFTTDAWADYLTFHFYPRQRIFVDGRCDFFGKEMSEQYVQILKGHYGWDALMERYDFDAALIPSQSALASLLRVRADWQVVNEDGLAILFRRTP